LTGNWYGELRTATGAMPVYLEIRGKMPTGGCVSCPRINGRARFCESGAAVPEYGLSGDVDNWRGTRFHVTFTRLSEGGTGTGPGALRGEWQGDEIRATGVLVATSPVASASTTRDTERPSEPRLEYTLRRGSEDAFLAACRRH
jgi:hypothetical protein